MNSKNLYWLCLSLIVFIVDQASKSFAAGHLVPLSKTPLLPFFNLCLSFNKGAAFGFLHTAGGWQCWFFIVVGIIICASILVWLCQLPKQAKLICAALALIFGGAMGNLWDRFVFCYVIDFIQLHLGQWYFPTFNFADSAISVGAILVLLTLHSAKNSGQNKI